MDEADADTGQPAMTKLPASDSGAQTTARGTTSRIEAGGMAAIRATASGASTQGETLPAGVTRLRLGTRSHRLFPSKREEVHAPATSPSNTKTGLHPSGSKDHKVSKVA